VKVTGNIKFDIHDRNNYEQLHKLGLEKGEKLFVAGSTHEGEEEIIVAAYKKLLERFARLRLLIAPRHIERIQYIENLVYRYGFDTICVSAFPNAKGPVMASRASTFNSRLAPIFLLDKMGVLKSLYSLATLVFVGGSLVPHGGQNLIEPASVSKPILFGPYVFNFQDVADQLLEQNAAFLINSNEELVEIASRLLGNPQEMNTVGSRAKGVVEQNKGATVRTMKLIRTVIESMPGRGV
jgi:3-deoxy-D-manno-octulosonic-acid transferase